MLENLQICNTFSNSVLEKKTNGSLKLHVWEGINKSLKYLIEKHAQASWEILFLWLELVVTDKIWRKGSTGQRRPWAISLHFNGWLLFVVVLKASVYKQLVWISIYDLKKSWPIILNSIFPFQHKTIRIISKLDSSVYVFLNKTLSHKCWPLSTFVAARKKQSSTCFHSKCIQIQAAMSFNNLKIPE